MERRDEQVDKLVDERVARFMPSEQPLVRAAMKRSGWYKQAVKQNAIGGTRIGDYLDRAKADAMHALQDQVRKQPTHGAQA